MEIPLTKEVVYSAATLTGNCNRFSGLGASIQILLRASKSVVLATEGKRIINVSRPWLRQVLAVTPETKTTNCKVHKKTHTHTHFQKVKILQVKVDELKTSG